MTGGSFVHSPPLRSSVHASAYVSRLGPGRWALVVHGQASYGMGRMAEIITDGCRYDRNWGCRDAQYRPCPRGNFPLEMVTENRTTSGGRSGPRG